MPTSPRFAFADGTQVAAPPGTTPENATPTQKFSAAKANQLMANDNALAVDLAALTQVVANTPQLQQTGKLAPAVLPTGTAALIALGLLDSDGYIKAEYLPGGTTPAVAATPTSFAAGTPTATSIPLSWAGPTGATYVVQRATDSGFTTALTTIYTGPNTGVTNSSGLTASTAYSYRVKAQVAGKTDSDYATLQVSTIAAPVTILPLLGLAVDSARSARLAPSAAASDYAYTFSALATPAIILPPAGAIKVSQVAGVVSDANIADGSSAYGTDCTAAIQNFLLMSAGSLGFPLKVDWDVTVSATGLLLDSYTDIYTRLGCGGISRPNSSPYFFQNRHATYDPAAIVDTNIGIYGPGIWNGNSYSGSVPPSSDGGFNQRHSGADIGWTCPIRMYGVRNFTWDGGTILRQRTFAMHLINTEGLRLRNGVIDCGPAAPINTDGIHMNGYHNDFQITGWKINSADDKISISPNDALDRDVRGGNSTYYQGYAGNITNGLIDGIEFTGGIFGIRVLSGANSISNVTVRNLYGTTKDYWLVVDNFRQLPVFDGSGPGFVSDITFENIYVQCAAVQENYVLNCCANIACNATNVTFRNVYRSTFLAGFPSLLVYGAVTCTNLRVENYQGHDFDTAYSNAAVQIGSGATVNGLVLSGCRISQTAANTSTLVDNSGTLTGLVLTDCLGENITTLVTQH